jgi:hypothetical protein
VVRRIVAFFTQVTYNIYICLLHRRPSGTHPSIANTLLTLEALVMLVSRLKNEEGSSQIEFELAYPNRGSFFRFRFESTSLA